jgi:hypothetical protein
MREYKGVRKMTEEKRQQIVSMWQDGIAASKIGDKIGISRNSVIGVVHRLRASGADLSRHSENRVVKKKAKKTESIILKMGAVEMPEGITLLELKYMSCRYIVSEEKAATVLYCGKHIDKASYCKDHYKLCYQPIRR